MPVVSLVIEILFVMLLAGVVPALAFASRHRFDAGQMPTGRRLYAGVALQLLMLGGLAAGVAWATSREGMGTIQRPGMTLLACALFLCVTSAIIPWRWRVASAKERQRLGRLVPQGREDAWAWLVVSACAGWAEELAYRGVLTAILADWTGSLLAGALISAAAFGLAHAVQGRRSVAAASALGLALQGLCELSGSLVPAMLVHATYDVIAGLWYGRLAARSSG